MPEKKAAAAMSRPQAGAARVGQGSAAAPAAAPQAPQPSISEQVIRRHYKNLPVGIYRIKDQLINITSNASFLDSVLVLVAFLAVVSGLRFYPLPVVLVLLLLLFMATLLNPFLGLIVFTVFIFPIFMYQVPVLAWAFLIGATAILIYGYMHYRVAIFTYILTSLAFSPLGILLWIPFFIFSVLTIGNKRAVITAVASVSLIIMFSAVTGLQNTAYVVYNANTAQMAFPSPQITALDTPAGPGFGLANFSAGMSNTINNFVGGPVLGQVPNIFGALASPFLTNPFDYIIQLLVMVGIIFGIDLYAISSRSKHKGAMSSMIGMAYPVAYLLLSGGAGLFSPVYAAFAFISFIITPAGLYAMEYYGINTVRALEVKKSDIRMRFGEAFEDLAGGSTSESFDDIANYEATKKELKEAVIAPIEERGISRAYNVTPTKGILFFGPPGTGKTLMMRALANEIHGGFYYVKASNLISAYPGETEKKISDIFKIAKKNAPCILFFDEVEAVAPSREIGGADETHRQAMSALLQEIDGFEKKTSIIIVGATNRPDLMDAAMLRPGRFDKLIYLPLPDKEGRKKIFQMYLSKLPVSPSINLSELADKTERYSGADLKALCDNVAQQMAQAASNEHKVLEITQQDIMAVIKASKPSTTLSQVEDYENFKIDFERSQNKGAPRAQKEGIHIADVIGMEDAKKAIRDAIEIPLLHPDLMKKYDIRPINGLLLFGPPGVGKTMLMRAVNNEMSNVTMLELSGATLSDEGLERATSTIKEIFNRAKENAPSIIFIDEIDGVIPSREGASEMSIQITTEVLKEIDGVKSMANVVIVGATNLPDQLDPSMLRPGRFDKILFVRPPSAAERSEMFKKYLGNVPVEQGLDYDRLAADSRGFTGADIANVCREAKAAALAEEVSTGKQGTVTTEIARGIIKDTKPSAPDSALTRYQAFQSRYGRK